MSFEHARTIMAAERGKHFDPDVADAFLSSFDAFRAIAQRHRDSDTGVAPVAAS
jgi:putative two-component system response regulator